MFDTSNRGIEVLTDWQTLAAAKPGMIQSAYDVGLRPGTSPTAYAAALSRVLGPEYPIRCRRSPCHWP